MENRRLSSHTTMTPGKEVRTPSRSSKLHSLQLLSNGSANSSKFCTPQSIRHRNGTFSSFPIVNTPTPPSRFRKIINPFEAGLTERLHLPLIGSPSLFHRPATPQMCSTQLEFEWTIDEVSSLNPANVEAHETQFQSVLDPEIEAKAQAAISSFFKEQIIVPSPVDCSLRDQKIVLQLNNSFTECRPAPVKGKRDAHCQTVLTFPSVLPKEVEDALRPFFTFTQSQQQSPSIDCDRTVDAACANNDSIDHDARDASLRRKLFQPYTNASDTSSTEYDRDVFLDSPTPQTPELDLRNIRSQRFLTPQGGATDGAHDENQSPLNISLSPVKRESFGCISPISKVMAITPLPNTEKTIENESRTSASSLYRSTPERSTIFRSMSSSSINTSTDAATHDQHKITRSNGSELKRKSFHLGDERNVNFSCARSSSESNVTGDCSYDDDTHISSHSSYGSQQHPHTPTLNKSKRRRLSVNRKNLSLSFNSCVNEENMSVIEHTGAMTLNTREKAAVVAGDTGIQIDKTDSGFNETDDLVRSKHMQYGEKRNVVGDGDVSMTDAF